MKRKAILIESSNVRGQTDLPGARIDIENWEKFLKSELGGAWTTSEIVKLPKPTTWDVAEALKVDGDTYCLVAFSGHGSDGSVVLNEHWTSYPVDKLRPSSGRGTVIVDACRGVDEAQRYVFEHSIVLANTATERQVALNAKEGRSSTFRLDVYVANRAQIEVNHRTVWERALGITTGVVEMLACAKGQGAGEDPNAGGYYTSLLLQSASEWQGRSTPEKVHTTRNAHDYAALKLPKQQTPEYRPLTLSFPFAVKS